jgi:hypothetical protein
MAYHEREYDLFIIQGTKDSPDIWKWKHWESWAIALAPFAESLRGKSALRCNQYSLNQLQKIPFGKLAWDEKSHQRWTHGSPVNITNSSEWMFLGVEAWSPSWTACVRENMPPDFFFSMTNPNFNRTENIKDTPFIVCAIPALADSKKAQELELVLSNLAKSLPASLFAYKRRSWGVPSFPGSNGFTYAIQDIFKSPLSYAGNPNADPFEEDTLPETWRFIEL